MKIYEENGFKFFVDSFLESTFSKIIIEYIDSWFKKDFVVRVKD